MHRKNATKHLTRPAVHIACRPVVFACMLSVNFPRNKLNTCLAILVNEQCGLKYIACLDLSPH